MQTIELKGCIIECWFEEKICIIWGESCRSFENILKGEQGKTSFNYEEKLRFSIRLYIFDDLDKAKMRAK